MKQCRHMKKWLKNVRWWVQGLGTEETLQYERIDLHFESIRFCILRVWCIRMVSLVYDPQHSLRLILHSLQFWGGFWFISWRRLCFYENVSLHYESIRISFGEFDVWCFHLRVWEFSFAGVYNPQHSPQTFNVIQHHFVSTEIVLRRMVMEVDRWEVWWFLRLMLKHELIQINTWFFTPDSERIQLIWDALINHNFELMIRSN